jgi:hypothetical protein
MEENIKQQDEKPAEVSQQTLPALSAEVSQKKKKKHHPVVVVERDWKEYFGESLLIVFSVILALGLTEVISNLNEERRTKEILRQLREELIANKNAEEEQYVYHLQVLKNIDSALQFPAFAKRFINDSGEIDLTHTVAPHGVFRHDLSDVAWQVAKQNSIFSKMDFSTYSLLTDIYANQQRITNSEQEIAHVLLSFESRKPENLRITLILMRDNYHGWAVDRAPNLLNLYQRAIDRLAKY